MVKSSIDKSKFEDLKSSALQLNEKQVRDLQVLLDVRASQLEPTRDTKFETFVYEEVWVLLEGFLKTTKPPLAVMQPRLGKELRDATDRILEFLRAHVTFKDSEFPAYARYLAGLTMRRMIAFEIPVSAKTLLQQLANVATVVDDVFPGYAASGFLKFTLQRAITSRPSDFDDDEGEV